MISNLVDLNETLCVVARHIPVIKRRAIVKRVEVLICKMTDKKHYAANLQEGILIIKQMIAEAQNNPRLRREVSDLNLFLIKWQDKQENLLKQSQSLQNIYGGRVASGTIFSKYF